ncbi:hypothetical protein RZE82_09060 [Mollicutes bacterium LVI A0039]|nr:hypothetical protein RZE82_09060 [Mollicutes bacterium LVI A0039]
MIVGIACKNGSGKSLFVDQFFFEHNLTTTVCTNEVNFHPEYTVNDIVHLFKGTGKFVNDLEYYRRYDIASMMEKKAKFLSSGEMQKVKLYLAFSKPEQNLIFDEPTSFLNKDARALFFEDLITFKTQHNIILISHYKEDLEQVCDAIYNLDEDKERYEHDKLFDQV